MLLLGVTFPFRGMEVGMLATLWEKEQHKKEMTEALFIFKHF